MNNLLFIVCTRKEPPKAKNGPKLSLAQQKTDSGNGKPPLAVEDSCCRLPIADILSPVKSQVSRILVSLKSQRTVVFLLCVVQLCEFSADVNGNHQNTHTCCHKTYSVFGSFWQVLLLCTSIYCIIQIINYLSVWLAQMNTFGIGIFGCLSIFLL